MKKAIKYLTLIILLLLLFISILFGPFYYINFIKQNTQCANNKDIITLYLKRNSDTRMVYDSLVKLQILKDTTGLFSFMIRKNYQGKNIVPGKYNIKAGWTTNRLIDHLRAGNGKIDTKIVINSYRDYGSLSKKLSREILLDSSSIHDYLSNQDSMEIYGFDKPNQLCMFIPNTYFIDWDITERELFDGLYKEYNQFWNDERTLKASKIGLNTNEIQTLASIVTWETNDENDMPIIAGVYMNRLKQGIPLQADPTLIFAVGDFTIKRVLNVHKKIESPYNTYKYKGLPPGPILIPPIRYIDAVLDYTKHDYIFFVAKEDFSGQSYFSKTYEEHEKYADKYREALKQRGM